MVIENRPKPAGQGPEDLVGQKRFFRGASGQMVEAFVQPISLDAMGRQREILTGLTDEGAMVTAHWRKTKPVDKTEK